MDTDNPEDRKAYQFEDNSFQELEASEFNDQGARNRILLRTAVLSYVEQSDPAALIVLFEKGFPLYKYAESRELLIDLLSGIPIRSATDSNSQKGRDAEMKAAYYYATLTGSGKSPEEAAELAARGVPCEVDHFRDSVWPKFQDRPGVKIAYDMARNPPENFPEFF